MNKITAFLTAFLMCICFTACEESSVEKPEEAVTTTKTEVETETKTEAPTECDHKWIEATCESPKICEICGETEGQKSDHSTHTGKCTACGEYILDKAFIPDFDDFVDCVGLSEVPSEFKLSSSMSMSQTDTGFDAYFCIPNNKRIESCENLGWDICINYTGTEDFNIINTYTMNYVPKNQNELDELYSAIFNEYEKKFGSPTGNTWTHSTGEIELSIAKASNGVSVFMKSSW